MVRAPRWGPACNGMVMNATVSPIRRARIGRNTSRIRVPDSRTTRAGSQRPLVGRDGLARVIRIGRAVRRIWLHCGCRYLQAVTRYLLSVLAAQATLAAAAQATLAAAAQARASSISTERTSMR